MSATEGREIVENIRMLLIKAQELIDQFRPDDDHPELVKARKQMLGLKAAYIAASAACEGVIANEQREKELWERIQNWKVPKCFEQ